MESVDQREQADDHQRVHGLGDAQSGSDAQSARHAEEPLGAIEFVVLAGVDNVESGGPEVTAAVSQRIRGSSEPRTAIQAAAGAIPKAKPSTRCEKEVKRLVKE